MTSFADPAATATFGRRYLFGRLDQTTLSANIRLNWAFTPTMSLQTFVQPLISAGDYTEFKSLARPKSYEFDPYPYAGNPDFNIKSLRGDAVFRRRDARLLFSLRRAGIISTVSGHSAQYEVARCRMIPCLAHRLRRWLDCAHCSLCPC